MYSMKTFILFVFVLALINCRTYPMYKQCDPQWANDQLGTSSNTICSAGCLMSSAAMALSGTGHSYTPKTLNQWLKSNGGYVSGDLFVWASINKLGLTFKGFISNDKIKTNLDAGNVVILNVHNGGHWVLAYGYNGDNINVNDPGYQTNVYALNTIVNGNTGVYSLNTMPDFIMSWYYNAEELLYGIFGIKKQIVFAQRPSLDVHTIKQQ